MAVCGSECERVLILGVRRDVPDGVPFMTLPHDAQSHRNGVWAASAPPIVMIVDDDPTVCAAVCRLLRAEGLHVRIFVDTDELAATRRPDGICCLILDLHLPGRDGLAFLSFLNRAGV